MTSSSSLSRPLRPNEIICSSSSINFMLDIESSTFSLNALEQAIKLLAKRHPYYRLKFAPVYNNEKGRHVLEFREKTEEEFNEIELNQIQLESERELDDGWEKRLVEFSLQKDHDCLKSLIFVSVFTYKTRHQIYANINHAGKV